MPKARIQVIASSLGVIALCIEVTALVSWMSTGDAKNTVIVSNLGAIGFAFLTWTKVIWPKESKSAVPETCGEWLGMFVGGFLMSYLFLSIDCGHLPVFKPEFVCKGNPGFSVIFTIAAIGICIIALPSALRAWILKKYDVQSRD